MNAARACLALGLPALALGAWLAFPRPRAEASGAPLSIVLVDVSQSVVAPRPSWSAWVRARIADEALRARDERAEIAVVAFGQDVRRVRGPESAAALLDAAIEPLRDLARSGESATRLAAALELAAQLAQ